MTDGSVSWVVNSSYRLADDSHFFNNPASMRVPQSLTRPISGHKKRRDPASAKQGLFYVRYPRYLPFFAYFFLNRSTRPSVSTIFCVPVKNGWQLEQISTLISPTVDLVL